jgi:hypothetical protein
MLFNAFKYVKVKFKIIQNQQRLKFFACLKGMGNIPNGAQSRFP